MRGVRPVYPFNRNRMELLLSPGFRVSAAVHLWVPKSQLSMQSRQTTVAAVNRSFRRPGNSGPPNLAILSLWKVENEAWSYNCPEGLHQPICLPDYHGLIRRLNISTFINP